MPGDPKSNSHASNTSPQIRLGFVVENTKGYLIFGVCLAFHSFSGGGGIFLDFPQQSRGGVLFLGRVFLFFFLTGGSARVHFIVPVQKPGRSLNK